MTIKAIVTDIEGTTSSISFVHEVLFPYATQELPNYLKAHSDKHLDILEQVKEIINDADASLDKIIETFLEWIREDKKITPLKSLQGYIWENGYKNGDFKGHLYQDAYEALKSWYENGIELYVYSSGSIPAQKLLFGYTEYGDLTNFFKGNFDTTTGGKKEALSYQIIAKEIKHRPEHILFLSDSLDEIYAALQADYKVCLLDRENKILDFPHQKVDNFQNIIF